MSTTARNTEVGLQLEDLTSGLVHFFLFSKMSQGRRQTKMRRDEGGVLADGFPRRSHGLIEAAKADIGDPHRGNDAEHHWIERAEAHVLLVAVQRLFGLSRVKINDTPVTPRECRVGIKRDRLIDHLRGGSGICEYEGLGPADAGQSLRIVSIDAEDEL